MTASSWQFLISGSGFFLFALGHETESLAEETRIYQLISFLVSHRHVAGFSSRVAGRSTLDQCRVSSLILTERKYSLPSPIRLLCGRETHRTNRSLSRWYYLMRRGLETLSWLSCCKSQGILHLLSNVSISVAYHSR